MQEEQHDEARAHRRVTIAVATALCNAVQYLTTYKPSVEPSTLWNKADAVRLEEYLTQYNDFLLRYNEEAFVEATERQLTESREAAQLFELRAYNAKRFTPAMDHLILSWRGRKARECGMLFATVSDQLGIPVVTQLRSFLYQLKVIQ